MKKEKEFVPFKLGLNEVGEQVMSAYREYQKVKDTNSVIKDALIVYVDNFKKKDVSEKFRGEIEKDLVTALLGYKNFCVNEEYHCNQAYEFTVEDLVDIQSIAKR